MSATQPMRGDIWWVELSRTRGHEQAGRSPALVVSVDEFNQGLSNLVIVMPLTTRIRPIPLHVEVNLPEGGVARPSQVLCEQIRSISRSRLSEFIGAISTDTMAQVEHSMAALLFAEHSG